MATYQVCYNATTKVATVQNNGDAIPSGSTKLSTFKHGDGVAEGVANDKDGEVQSHVLYQHVRAALYFVGQQNMQIVRIDNDTDYVPLTGITVAPATKTLTVAAPTQQLTITKAPTGASNGTVTYVSSDPTKATVSATGLVTRVANGTTTVTATSQDGSFTSTCAVTCTA